MTSRPRLRSLLPMGAFGVGLAVVAVVACGAFGSDDPPAAPADGAPSGDTSTTTMDASTDASAPDADASVVCEPELPWASSESVGVPTTATCAGMPKVDLLTTQAHCGRCDHACGAGETCTSGHCPVHSLDPVATTLLTSVTGAQFYYLREATREVVALTLGSTPTVVASFDAFVADAGGLELNMNAAVVDDDALWMRSRNGLFRASLTDPPSTTYVGPLPYGGPSSMTTVGVGKLRITSPTEGPSGAPPGAVLLVDEDGGAYSAYVAPSPFAADGVKVAQAYYWVEEPWLSGPDAGPSNLRAHINQINFTLYTDPGELGGLAIDGNRAYMIRRGDAGGIVEVNLLDGDAGIFESEPRIKIDTNVSVAVDATHVYWIRPTDQFGAAAIVKRARCGGATVIVAPSVYGANKIALSQDRIVVSTYNSLVSIAK